MNEKEPHSTSGLAAWIFVSLLGGALLGASFMANLNGADGALIKLTGEKSDWLGFWGAIFGGGMTLVAAITAWRGLKDQIGAQERTISLLTREQTQRAIHCYLFLADRILDIETTTRGIEIDIREDEVHPGLGLDTSQFSISMETFSNDDTWLVDPDIMRVLRRLVRLCQRFDAGLKKLTERQQIKSSVNTIKTEVRRARDMVENRLKGLGYSRTALPGQKFYGGSRVEAGNSDDHPATSSAQTNNSNGSS